MKDKFHIPSLDGLRAVAAMLVFIAHNGLSHIIPGGFGVTIFFFLSGYLITTLMRQEYEQYGNISFKNFYLRRLYRIAPPMYLVIILILVLSAVGLIKSSPSLGGLMAGLFQYTNYYYLNNGEQDLIPFTAPYWSLAIEEHFYLIFPALFLFLVRRCTYKKMALALLGLCVVDLIWRIVLIKALGSDPGRNYWATDTRLDSLLYGCVMAMWCNPVLDKIDPFKSVKVKWAVLFVSLGVLLFTLAFRNETFRQTLRYTLQGAALFPIFWLAIRHADWVAFKWLNTKPLKFLGLISYTFYLSHIFWIDVAERLTKGKVAAGVLAFVLTVGFAYAMYLFVESPFARLRKKLHGREAQLRAVAVKV